MSGEIIFIKEQFFIPISVEKKTKDKEKQAKEEALAELGRLRKSIRQK
ncbi:hypothetical protein [Thermoflexibacter ruber]|nr:hypothetical protein [Thermoflexibacter ruber]